MKTLKSTDKANMVIAPPQSTRSNFSATESPSRVSEGQAAWALPGELLDGGEIIILAIKPSMWRPVFESAAWLIAAGVLATALTVLGAPLPGMSVTTTAQLILLVGLGRFGWAVIQWVPTWYVLTNRRLLQVHGIRQPVIASTPLLEVRNTYVNASPIEGIGRLGTITYVTIHEEDPPRYWHSVSNPVQVHNEIRRAIENAIDQHGGA